MANLDAKFWNDTSNSTSLALKILSLFSYRDAALYLGQVCMCSATVQDISTIDNVTQYEFSYGSIYKCTNGSWATHAGATKGQISTLLNYSKLAS